MFSFGAQVWPLFNGANFAVSFFVREYKYNRQKWWTVSLLEDFVILLFWARKPFGSTWTFLGDLVVSPKSREKVRTWQFFTPFQRRIVTSNDRGSQRSRLESPGTLRLLDSKDLEAGIGSYIPYHPWDDCIFTYMNA